MRKQLIYLCLGYCWLLCLPPLIAQDTQQVNNKIPTLYLSEKLPDTTIDLTVNTSVYVAEIANPIDIEQARQEWEKGAFIPLSELTYLTKFKTGAYHYWLQFQLENTSSDTLDLIYRMPRYQTF